MEITYRIIQPAEYNIFYELINQDDSWWAFSPSLGQLSACDWNAYCGNENVLSLGCFVDNAPAGLLQGIAFSDASRAMRIAVIAFREYAKIAPVMMRGAADWVFASIDCACMFGEVPSTNRHVMNLLQKTGFEKQGSIPELYWSDAKQKFVNATIVVCTPESLRKAKLDANIDL